MNKEVNEERAPRTVEDVKEMLTKHSNGEIQRTIQNCITILQNDHVLADAIRLNLLSERIDIVKPVGWPRSGKTLSDTDMKYILRRMEKYGISSEKKIESAIRIVANENRYHPIRDYLNGLVWDGKERIRYCLRHFLGADTDNYTFQSLRLFLLSRLLPISKKAPITSNSPSRSLTLTAPSSRFFPMTARSVSATTSVSTRRQSR